MRQRRLIAAAARQVTDATSDTAVNPGDADFDTAHSGKGGSGVSGTGLGGLVVITRPDGSKKVFTESGTFSV